MLSFAPFNDDATPGLLLSYISAVSTCLQTELSPGVLGASKISIARHNLFAHYTVVQNPCFRCRDSRTSSSWSATTWYLANPELTTTPQNLKYKLLNNPRHFFKIYTAVDKINLYFHHHQLLLVVLKRINERKRFCK